MEIDRFIGKVYWLSGNIFRENDGSEPLIASIKRGILNGKEFKIETESTNDEEGGLLKLSSQDGNSFTGTFTYNTSNSPDARISFKYYTNAMGAILIGEWIQDTYVYTTIIELERVSEFT